MVNVILTGDITGARDGQPWPPAGTEVDLPEGEAQSLIHSGMAKASSGSDETKRLAEAAVVDLDEVTEAQVRNATTTRERQAQSKRAHEPLNLGVADELQPVEDDNGPRLPEVNAEEAAKVQDPAVDTSSEEGITNERKAPSPEGEAGDKVDLTPKPQPAKKAAPAKDAK